jgi:hypothetical protein
MQQQGIDHRPRQWDNRGRSAPQTVPTAPESPWTTQGNNSNKNPRTTKVWGNYTAFGPGERYMGW